MKRFFAIIAVLAATMPSAISRTPDNTGKTPYVTKECRMDRSKLNIGTYILQPYARTEAHVKDLADCGIDFVIGLDNDRKTLDLFSKYGVGAVVSGVVPGWWGGDGDNAGKLEATNPLSKYEEQAAGFTDHPAIWGIDIGDEPSAVDFPYYGKVTAKVEQLFPNQFAYLNIYPNGASVAKSAEDQTVNQLGTTSYREYIAEYCKNVPMDYLSYDFYVFSWDDHQVHQMYDNLRIVADACTGTSRSMWIVVQVNSDKKENWISMNQLRFQAWTAMAFGTEVISWACYTAGWFHNQVLDEKGEKTQQYDKLKKVNAEIHALSEPYMKYRRISSALIGFEGTDWLEDVGQNSVNAYDNGTVSGLQADDGSPIVVGDMVARCGDGGRALFVTSADDPYDKAPKAHTILFKADGREVKASGPYGEVKLGKTPSGWYSCPLASNEAVLIEFSPR
ncbi:MAG: hypothetical protein IJK96_06790 [Bacteroidales bacterium]|nr:hypothetical protein [Bacteroidales bacterium]